ncbi:hypothetical protein DERP_001606 [Dermatophagoides pteronyssinus]|uniref:Transmembrane protein n=1 Tax=Dermatophagoides pteronyssinus TaxID=6956 RepID=A0ABQ8JBG6_DERPT|nr:hypothetical protein DERP_001606 [Dermatophagoides pteronyssinus]
MGLYHYLFKSAHTDFTLRSKAILQESDFTITLTNTSPLSTDNDDDHQLDQTSEHQNIHAMVLTGFFFLFSLSHSFQYIGSLRLDKHSGDDDDVLKFSCMIFG